MGISDKLWFKFTCPQCATAEVISVSDKGSTWGGPSWQSLSEPASFAITTAERAGGEPEVTSATCKACQVTANVSSAYGFTKPTDF